MSSEDFLSVIGEAWRLDSFHPGHQPLVHYTIPFSQWLGLHTARNNMTMTDLLTLDNQQLADMLTRRPPE